jgi:hypothetical protein
MGDGRPYQSSSQWFLLSIVLIIALLLYSHYTEKREYRPNISKVMLKEIVSEEMGKVRASQVSTSSSR